MADAPSLSRPTLPGEPPPGVTSEMLWRLAARLFADHRPGPGRPDSAPDRQCGSCRQSWPCSGRRLAELGLYRATA